MSAYYHVVLMKIRADADAAFHEAVRGYCRQILASCPGVLSYDYFANEASRSQGHDFAIVARFVSSPAHDAYQADPIHLAMKGFMAPYIENMVVLDGLSAESGPG